MESRARTFRRASFVLLIALTCLSQGFSPREKRFLWPAIEETLPSIQQQVGRGIQTGTIIFQQPWIRKTTTSTTPSTTTSTTPSTTTTNDSDVPEFRQIISAPVRCPPNHALVMGKCRLIFR